MGSTKISGEAEIAHLPVARLPCVKICLGWLINCMSLAIYDLVELTKHYSIFDMISAASNRDMMAITPAGVVTVGGELSAWEATNT